MRTAVAVTCASAALLAGCGDDDTSSSDRLSKSDYEREYREVVKRVDPRGVDKTRLGTPRGAGAAFAELRTRFQRLASEMEKLRPPTEVDQAQRDFVAGLRGSAKDLDPMVELFRRNDWDAIQRVMEQRRTLASPQTTALIDKARAAFDEHGYDIDLTQAGLPGPASTSK
jgi:hypothetical protein